MIAKRRCRYFILTMAIPAVMYVWGLWYYGKLYRSGQLLFVSEVTPDVLVQTLLQNTLALLPELLTVVIALILLGRKRFAEEMGLYLRTPKKAALLLAAGFCLLALVMAFLFAESNPLAVSYQWAYYLLFVAFAEEIIFRGLLPFLVQQSDVPIWMIWVVPGALFSCMHTLMPMIYNGFTVKAFIWNTLVMLGGYTLGHCGYYALRRWSDTLWLPVLVHGTLDFLSIFTKQ